MTLVEILRGRGTTHLSVSEIMRQAADEIERYRKSLEQAEGEHAHTVRKANEAARIIGDECERQRERAEQAEAKLAAAEAGARDVARPAVTQDFRATEFDTYAAAEAGAREPLPMLLFCPACNMQHVDAPQPEKDWANPPHRSHECQGCGYVWRPADALTTGVAAIATKGKADRSPIPAAEAGAREPMDAEHWAELYRLREEVKGPDGHATWKDAAIAERRLREQTK